MPGEAHGQRSPVGYSPQDHKESDTTEHTRTQRFKGRNAAPPRDQVDTKPGAVSTFPKRFLTVALPSVCPTLLAHY